MSIKSTSDGDSRTLTLDESRILHEMLSSKPEFAHLAERLRECRVRDMNDGGMGSLRFEALAELEPRFGRTIVEGTFTDEDGVEVQISINVDEAGELYELDVWRVDFAPLKKLPSRVTIA